MKIANWLLSACLLFGATSCDDFLDTVPGDALSPSTTWKTEDDARKFLVGCYDGWIDDSDILYWDCASDFGYNEFIHEGFRLIGNGTLSPTNEVADYYNFTLIRRCNDFLANIENVEFSDQDEKNDLIGQVTLIRAYRYFIMNQLYGGVPIIDSYTSAEEAMVARNTEEEVKQFVYSELDRAIPMLRKMPAAKGYLARGAALALKVRSALFYSDWQRAHDAAKELIDMGEYDLESDYSRLFLVEGQNSKEIIAAIPHDTNIMSSWMIATMYNNADGGWSSMVPTQNLVDTYEMANGLTRDEPGSGYDPVHPYANRDPRMAMTVIYPGQDWNGGILNTLEKIVNGANNPNDPNATDNASKTSLTWAKYTGGSPDYYADMWSANANIIIFRYAEVLLSLAEASNELSGPSAEVYDALDRVRQRAGMPVVDRNKYSTRETLRELIHRERGVELAGEGQRRFDIIRWKDAEGRMLAETLMTGPLTRVKGTIDYSEPDPEKRAVVTGTDLIEVRKFQPWHRYLPIAQTHLEKNPKLTQNSGY